MPPPSGYATVNYYAIIFIAGLDRIFKLYDHVNPGVTVGTGAHTVRMASLLCGVDTDLRYYVIRDVIVL